MPDMRFAPPPAIRVADHAGGMNQVLARSFNERLIMSLLLQNNGMTRMQLGQESGLSAQTVSVIVRALERDNLISKGEAVRGRIGPPTTPINLNPEGSYSIGIHVEHQSVSAMLIDFIGAPRIKKSQDLQMLDVPSILSASVALTQELLNECGETQRALVAGLGLTLPRAFENDQSAADQILEHDFERDLQHQTGLEIFIQNDVTATASAETMFGVARKSNDLLFCHIGLDLKPRLILGGRIYAGIAPSQDLRSTGLGVDDFAQVQAAEQFDDPLVDRWRKESVQALTRLVQDLGKFVKIADFVVSAPVARELTGLIVADVQENVAEAINVHPSQFGRDAMALGAAAIPFHSKFMSGDK